MVVTQGPTPPGFRWPRAPVQMDADQTEPVAYTPSLPAFEPVVDEPPQAVAPVTAVPASVLYPPPTPVPAVVHRPTIVVAPPPAAAPPRSSHAVWIVAGAAVVAFVMAISAVFIVKGLRNRPASPTLLPATTAKATATLKPTDAGAPRNVQLADGGSSVTLKWTDSTPGSVQFAVLGGQRGAEPKLQKVLSPGTTTLTLQGLSTDADYCYIVMAILSTESYARAPEVCTHRFP